MNKILLIIQREYLTRVKKKSFIVMTLLTPLIIAGFYAAAIFFAVRGQDTKSIKVVDESGLFENSFQDTKSLDYTYSGDDLELSKEEVKDGKYDGLLHIPDFNVDEPAGFGLFFMESLGINIQEDLERKLENEIEDIRLARSGIDKNALEAIETNLSLPALSLKGEEERKSNTGIATMIGAISGFLIYIFLFVYGTQVMRGVIEEKSSRIVEIIISSTKPMQLMLGKIIGIACVGLTQFLIWVVFTFILWTAVGSIFMGDTSPESVNAIASTEQVVDERAQMVERITSDINEFPILKITLTLLFYFLTGYLFYAALFAMIGSAVDSEADSQQFIFPVIMPIIFAIMLSGAIINDPQGGLAFWMSMIPLTSPIIMMIRVPFGIPDWQLLLSMALMIGGFLGTTWVAARVYRVGILIHGSKVNYKTMFKWFFMKN